MTPDRSQPMNAELRDVLERNATILTCIRDTYARIAESHEGEPNGDLAATWVAALDAGLAAISRPVVPEGDGWMPIETCPSGEVLLYWPATGPVRGRAGPKFHERVAVGRKGGTPFRPPTHWRPLPAPPAARSAEEK